MLIAKKSMRYGGRRLAVGETFDAGKRDARILKAIGKADDAPVSVPEPAADPESFKPLGQDPLDHDEDDKRGGSKLAAKGRYKRRDLRAED
jgi:hypothetical protein